jgi:hypothetical protein
MCYLTTLSVLRLYSVGWSNDRWIVKDSERKVLGLIEVISCHLSEWTEESLDKTQNSRCPALNYPVPPWTTQYRFVPSWTSLNYPTPFYTAMNCSELPSTVLYRPGSPWTTQYRSGPPWTIQYRSVPPWTALNYTGPFCTALDRPELPSTVLYRPGLPWTTQYRSVPPWTALNYPVPFCITLDCPELPSTVLYRPELASTVLYRPELPSAVLYRPGSAAAPPPAPSGHCAAAEGYDVIVTRLWRLEDNGEARQLQEDVNRGRPRRFLWPQCRDLTSVTASRHVLQWSSLLVIRRSLQSK